MDANELAILSVDDLGLDPLTAFARLRTFTPGRAAFLLESLSFDGEPGRYSVVGYRVRSCEALLPGVDAVAAQAESYEAKPGPESFAAALALGAVGFFSSSIASVWNRVRLFEDEGSSAMFATGATVALFDHHAGSVTVAGPAKGRVAERCVWEMKNGPDPRPLATVEADAAPPHVHADVPDEKFQARAARAKPFLSELEALTLARTFTTPTGQADAFDAYRALRASRPANANEPGFYIDFGESPVQARLQLFGVGTSCLHQRAHAAPGPALHEALRAALPSRAAVGAPAGDALRLVRQLEDASRQTWGGAVGVVAPGGASSFLLGDEIVAVQHGAFWCTAGAGVTETSEPLRVGEQTRGAVAARLHAIAVAHATALL